ncbi:tRNA-specific adenosine deaminase subunit Tad2p [[Candida] anglica]
MDLSESFRKMALCLFVGYRALSINETPVACILVSDEDQSVLSIGYNDTNRSLNGTRHAEFLAIDKVLSTRCNGVSGSVLPERTTLYVTVEPCIMCASALKQVGISTVVYGCGNDRFGGNGTVLSIHEGNYKILPGILRTEAIQLLRNFYIQENESAPDPKIKKNKDLDNKEYPTMDYSRYMDRASFLESYGSERINVYSGDTEITPVFGSGYSIRDLISLEQVLSLPGIEVMYPNGKENLEIFIEQDLNRFYKMFYDINNEGHVNFSGSILTTDSDDYIDTKRRKVE